MLLYAKKDTYIKLKGQGSQASELHDTEKFELLKGESLAINWTREFGDHIKFELETPLKGRYNWYIYKPHAKFKKGNEKDVKYPIPESNGLDPVQDIDWNNPQSEISKYFRVYEVTQHDKRRIPKNPEHIENILKLAKEVDKIRQEWGSGLIVTSWYRPDRPININKAVGGVGNSKHIPGLGIDIAPANRDYAGFRKFILQMGWKGGVGDGVSTGKGFMHLDARAGFPCWKEGQPVVPVWGY